jgi:hypothetical protein
LRYGAERAAGVHFSHPFNFVFSTITVEWYGVFGCLWKTNIMARNTNNKRQMDNGEHNMNNNMNSDMSNNRRGNTGRTSNQGRKMASGGSKETNNQGRPKESLDR